MKARKWIFRTMAIIAALMCLIFLIAKDWIEAIILLGVVAIFWNYSAPQPKSATTATMSASDSGSPVLDNLTAMEISNDVHDIVDTFDGPDFD